MRKFVKQVSKKVAKLSDEQVVYLFDELTEENEMLDAVIDSLSIGLIVCDEQWNLLFDNKAAERFIVFKQRTFDAPSNRQTENRLEIPVWDLIEDENIVDFLKTAQQKQTNLTSGDFPVLSPCGIDRTLVLTTMPFVKEKRLIGTIIKIDDITEKRKQETLIRQMESLASLTTLAANVAHEIKNPLGSISIYIQLIQKALLKARKEEKLPDEKYAENYLSVITEEIDRLNQIIVDFLFAVRPLNATCELLNPNELILPLIDFFAPELEKSHIAFEVLLLEKTPHLLIDAKLFKQALINLFQNAQAAMEDGGVLWISSQIKNDRYILNIADNGKGIDAKTMTHIFEPYFTTKAKGTGLGLTMVYKIIKDFSGEITVHSFPDEGSVFTISLPIPQKELRLLD